MRPHSVLIVDDEPGILRILTIALERRGCLTEVAQDGREAMDRVRGRTFDVIVTDINMPGYGGLEFLRAVRARDLDVPVILTTGQPTLDGSNLAVEFGAFRYLIKPILPSAIVDLVEQAAETHDTARRKRQALELHDRTLDDRSALERKFAAGLCKMRLAFQPIVSWSQRRVFAYEALLRSDEPTIASPLTFLEAAASLGKLHDLGRAIRARAGEAGRKDAVDLFVNLHPFDLNDIDLYDRGGPLAQMASRVVLELTEQVSLEHVADAPDRIARLRRMGFRVALDDVGAGYAGLTNLSRYRPDFAKVDMALVRGVDADPAKRCIVRSVAAVCAELGITVIAEGVETVAERDTLLELGCDLLQGYLFGKPGAIDRERAVRAGPSREDAPSGGLRSDA